MRKIKAVIGGEPVAWIDGSQVRVQDVSQLVTAGGGVATVEHTSMKVVKVGEKEFMVTEDDEPGVKEPTVYLGQEEMAAIQKMIDEGTATPPAPDLPGILRIQRQLDDIAEELRTTKRLVSLIATGKEANTPAMPQAAKPSPATSKSGRSHGARTLPRTQAGNVKWAYSSQGGILKALIHVSSGIGPFSTANVPDMVWSFYAAMDERETFWPSRKQIRSAVNNLVRDGVWRKLFVPTQWLQGLEDRIPHLRRPGARRGKLYLQIDGSKLSRAKKLSIAMEGEGGRYSFSTHPAEVPNMATYEPVFAPRTEGATSGFWKMVGTA